MGDYKEFWMVWRDNGHAPTRKHATEAEARSEAERLARVNPGAELHVLQAFASCKKLDVMWRGEFPNEVPF